MGLAVFGYAAVPIVWTTAEGVVELGTLICGKGHGIFFLLKDVERESARATQPALQGNPVACGV